MRAHTLQIYTEYFNLSAQYFYSYCKTIFGIDRIGSGLSPGKIGGDLTAFADQSACLQLGELCRDRGPAEP